MIKMHKLLTAVLKLVSISLFITVFTLSVVKNVNAMDIYSSNTKNLVRSQLWYMGINSLQDAEITEELVKEEESANLMPEELERALVMFELKEKGHSL
ncbi:hypothetical protein OAT67_07765 [Bacteriovoracaceae bacterium]|nr:hypothetical protein [Bacteriovoracaceae bacterium]